MNVSMVLSSLAVSQPNEKVEKAEVTSRAIVEYTEAKLPAPFKQLEQNTDLNNAPDSWLRNNLAGKFLETSIRQMKILDLSSFRMARNYLDYVGKVDFISDAENIKRLLKTPYSDAGLSMVVHKIQNTLLINELDVPRILTAAAEKSPEFYNRLEWLKNLYCDVLNIPKDSQFPKKKQNKEQIRLQSMLSKFLHHSITDEDHSEVPDIRSLACENQGNNEVTGELIDPSFQYSSLKQEIAENQTTTFDVEPSFQQNMLWTFEDITMLVGSNMPIFGGGRFPAVSLRLRDADKPINILTGLDYWLDNLMCNVPELLMCYHLEGIVQKYEVIKTEDLPNLDECRFSPKVVKDIAQDIMSFLRSKCTKEGHTYWLFRGGKSDIVKLYDLTSICSEDSESDRQNPFTTSVTNLLYRIARNMIANGIRCKKDAATAISLLQKCIKLLDNDQHPEMIMATNYLLAYLYMQEDIQDKGELQTRTAVSPSTDDDEIRKRRGNANQKIANIDNPSREAESGPLLDSNKEEKCRAVIKFVIEALDCYDIISQTNVQRQRSLTYDLNAADEKTAQATAVSMETEQTSKSVVLLGDDDSELNTLIDLPVIFNNSNIDCKTQLKIFAMNAYASLAELSIGKEKYARALRFVKVALICMDSIRSRELDSLRLLHAKLSMMCGDVALILAHKRNISSEEFRSLNQDDQEFLRLCSEESCFTDASAIKSSIDVIFSLSVEDLLIRSVGWYEESLQLSPSNEEHENVAQVVAVTARLGNVRNELGVFYMNAASGIAKAFGDPSTDEQQLWRKSFQYFEKGIQAFEVIDDRPNIALIHSNAARLMRLCAQCYGNSTRLVETDARGPFTQQEKLYFNKAFEFYQKAFACLGTREKMPEVWDRVCFELSGAYFSMGSLMQDNPPLDSFSHDEIMKDIQSLMIKALHYCEEEEKNESSPRYKRIRSRTAKIHHRIASLYQHLYRNKIEDKTSKKYKSLAELHYNKAYAYMNDEALACEYLSVLTEHIGLHTHHVTHSASKLSNIRRQRQALILLLKEETITQLHNLVKLVAARSGVKLNIRQDDSPIHSRSEAEKEQQSNEDDTHEGLLKYKLEMIEEYTIEQVIKTLDLLDWQLSNTLKDLISTFSSKQAKVKAVDKLTVAEVKKMYEIYIRASILQNKDDNLLIATERKADALAGIIDKIRSSPAFIVLK